MEQLIFFAVLIVFSILESIAKSRRQKKSGPPLPEPPPEPESEYQWPPPRRDPAGHPRTSVPPSYDEDASFDSRLPADEARSLEAQTSYDQTAASEQERRRRDASSESMIPADIWEEIAGLAREAKVELPAPAPRPRPGQLPRPQPSQPRRVPEGRKPAAKPPARPRPYAPPPRIPPAPARLPDVEGRPDHAVHLSHAGYGTDPSERAASAQDALRPLAQPVNADATAVRAQLRGQGASALRQALILHEILGPPAASKPD
jgi:hypothetical protein